MVNELKKINSDAEMRQLMELHERTETCLALTRGYAFNEGRQLGREEGREEGEALLCLNMLERGMNAADIAKVTGLSEKQVLKLIDKVRKDHKVSEPAPRYKDEKTRKRP